MLYAFVKRFLLICFIFAPFNIPAQNYKQILVLNSYSKGYKWSDDIFKGIERVFDNSVDEYSISIEYMGTKHISDESYFQQLYELYKRKYASNNFDVIITSDDNAFNFIKKYREDLFPKVPVVFCGVNNYDPEKSLTFTNFTGVNEAIDIQSTIELALNIHPNTNKVFFITDNTTTGKKNQKEFLWVKDLFPEITFKLLNDYSMEELCEKLDSLKEGSIVLYTLFFRDKENVFYEYDESISIITSHCKVPVYGTWDFSLGYGIIGGKLTSGFYQGETAAKLALTILSGVPASSIPVKMKSPNRFIFDFNQLQKQNILVDDLPSGSEIINVPDSFYEENKILVWIILSLFFILLVFITFLLLYISRKRSMTKIIKNLNAELEEKIKKRTNEISEINSKLLKELDERKKIEVELRNRNKFIEIILDNLPVGLIVTKSNSFRTSYSNEKFRQIVGWPVEIIKKVDKLFLNLFPNEKYRKKILPYLFPNKFQSNDIDKLENVRIRCKDGTIRIVNGINISIPEQQLEIMTLQDETEKIIVQEELIKQKDLMGNVISNIPYYVYWKDINSEYLGCNESFANWAGLKNSQDIIGLKDEELVKNNKFIEKLQKNDLDIIKNAAAVSNFEESYTNPEGLTSYFHINKVPLYDTKKRIIGVLGIFSDITEEKNAQKSKDLLEIELRQAQKIDSIGKLAAGIAHEINTPIQFVGDNTNFLKDAFSDLIYLSSKFLEVIKLFKKKENIDNQLSQLERQMESIDLEYIVQDVPVAIDQSLDGIKRVSALVLAMKEFSHKGLQNKSKIDLNKAVENTIIVSRNEWKLNADIETNLNPNLQHIEGMPSQINQVLLILIINASHAIMEKDKCVKGKICVTTYQNKEHVVVEISDTGAGISEENKAKIFDPFFTTKDVGKGTGQGLSIARDIIVNKHNGSISFNSEVGVGTTFIINLPFK